MSKVSLHTMVLYLWWKMGLPRWLWWINYSKTVAQTDCVQIYLNVRIQRCLYLGDICNRLMDCPFGDDETTCTLMNTQCPSFCQCLTFVISCQNAKTTNGNVLEMLPYHTVMIKHSNEHFIENTLKLLMYSRLIIVKSNKLQSICFHFSMSHDSLLIDLGLQQD